MTSRDTAQLHDDALAIWKAGLDAVRSDALVRANLGVDSGRLLIADEPPLALDDVRRIIVVGAGKAGAGMAAGVEAALGQRWMDATQLTGWVNVPADCVRNLSRIRLHAARPAGKNEPTDEGVAGTLEILRLLGEAGPEDLCLCLISGGGSALLPAPAEGISLGDKLTITRHLSGAGADIAELNTVRKHLSRVKGGRLARACRAGRLVSLIVSDVLGDPLDLIASGPTVTDESSPAEALAILQKYGATDAGVSPHLFALLEEAAKEHAPPEEPTCEVTNLIIGNNATAVDAAGQEAVRRGYSPAMTAETELEGYADQVGRKIAHMAVKMRGKPGPDCLIWGGEPTVKLAPPQRRGKGGRNQQLVLAALDEIESQGESAENIAILSGGTDGEDGPTDAAGAIFDARIAAAAKEQSLDRRDYLERNDAYHFFARLGGLLQTGPTHTNVCDVRVCVVSRQD